MDTNTLVENQIDDGQKLLDRLSEKGFILRAACWVKPIDEDRWSLYIATPAVDQKGKLEAYRQLIPVLQSLEDGWLTSSDVTLVGEKHPLVQDALDIQRRFPHKMPIPSPYSLIGGIPVDEVYVYQMEKEEVTIYGLIFRGDPSGSLHLSLEPHNPHSTLTIENNVYPAETGIDWVVAAPKGATLERNDVRQIVLVWELRGNRMRSSANEVWSLAKLGLHGFLVLREPGLRDTGSSRAESHAST
jgi:hypothetical protein